MLIHSFFAGVAAGAAIVGIVAISLQEQDRQSAARLRESNRLCGEQLQVLVQQATVPGSANIVGNGNAVSAAPERK